MQIQDIGVIGESQALEYLLERGYSLVERNFQRIDGEIDLIMKDADTYVFVEVRTRIQDKDVKPEDSIDWAKLKQLEQIVEIYIYTNEIYDLCRIDAVCIELSKRMNLLRLDHYKNISGDG